MIKVKTGDGKLTFEAETEDELRIIMNVIATGGVKPMSQEPQKPVPDKESFIILYNTLSENALKIIQALRTNVNGMTAEDFDTSLRLSGGVLGGTLGGITKLANRLGINNEDIIRYFSGKYYLGNKMRTEIEANRLA